MNRPDFGVWITAVEAAQRRAEKSAPGDEQFSPIVREIVVSADRCLLLLKQIHDMLTRSMARHADDTTRVDRRTLG